MSPPRPPLAAVVAATLRALESGEPVNARASIRSDGADAHVDLAARLKFVDDRNLAIDVRLAESDAEASAVTALSPTPALTHRERTVVSLIAEGKETREIASSLHISPETVRTHVRNSMSKAGAHTRAQLVAIVMESADSNKSIH
jgi:DNA-binding CsgD family transcriptional regulator